MTFAEIILSSLISLYTDITEYTEIDADPPTDEPSDWAQMEGSLGEMIAGRP
jgi:hypothetical protein